MKRRLAVTIMTVGVLFVGFALCLLIYNNYEDRKADKNSGSIVDSIRVHIDENKVNNETVDPFDYEMTVVKIDGYGYIGYLSVPTLDLDLPVMSEWDYDRLKIAPCRYQGSTKTDNLVIAAHNYKVHFKYLGNLKAGDPVIFTDMDSNISNYKVVSVGTVEPTDVDKVKESDADLILYTCTYGGAKRIVVKCNYSE